MKYCITLYRNCSIQDKVDEMIIHYNPKDETLFEYIELHKDQRIIIDVGDIESFIENSYIARFLAFKGAKPELTNWCFRIPHGPNQREAEQKLWKDFESTGIAFFSSEFIHDWDALDAYLSTAATDVYVTEALCFELDKVAKVVHDAGKRVRVFPNVAQSSTMRWCNGIKTFFIRPEDIEFYEPYVDVCEIWAEDQKQVVYYDIYAKDKKWFGPLKEIIIGLKSDIDSRFILPRFAERRIKCGKDCFKGGKCKMCDRIEELSFTLKEAGLLVKMKENKDERGSDELS